MDELVVFDSLGLDGHDVIRCRFDHEVPYAVVDYKLEGSTLVHVGVALVTVPAAEVEEAAGTWATSAHHCVVGVVARHRGSVRLIATDAATVAVATDGLERDYHGQAISGIRVPGGIRRGCRLASHPRFRYDRRAKIHLLHGAHHYCPAYGGLIGTIHGGLLPLCSWKPSREVVSYVIALPVLVTNQLTRLTSSLVRHNLDMTPMYAVGPCPRTEDWSATTLGPPTLLRHCATFQGIQLDCSSGTDDETKHPDPKTLNF